MKKSKRRHIISVLLSTSLVYLGGTSAIFLHVNSALASEIEPGNQTYYKQDSSGTITGNVAGTVPQALDTLFVNQAYSTAANTAYGVYLSNAGVKLNFNNSADTIYNINVDYKNAAGNAAAYGIYTFYPAASEVTNNNLKLLVNNMAGSTETTAAGSLTAKAIGIESSEAAILAGVKKITVYNQAGKSAGDVAVKTQGINSTSIALADSLQVEINSSGGDIIYDQGGFANNTNSNSVTGIAVTAAGTAGDNIKVAINMTGGNVVSNTTGGVRYSNQGTVVIGGGSGWSANPPATYLGANTVLIGTAQGGTVVASGNANVTYYNAVDGAMNMGFGDNTCIMVTAVGGTVTCNNPVGQIPVENHAYALTGSASLKGNTYLEAVATPALINGKESATKAYIFNAKPTGDYQYGGYAYINSKDDPRADGGYLADAVVQLKGDINIDQTIYGGGRLYANIEGENSYFKGTVLQYNDNYLGSEQYKNGVLLSFDKGAVWELANNSKNSETNGGKYVITLSDIPTADLSGYKPLYQNGIEVYRLNVGSEVTINLTSDGAERTFTNGTNNSYRTLSSNSKIYNITDTPGGFNITGSGNKFIVDSDVANNIADKIVIDTAVSGTNYIGVSYDVSFGNGTMESVDGKALVVKYNDSEDKFSGVKFTGKIADEGLQKFRPKVYQGIELGDASDYDWYLTGFEKIGHSDIVDDTKKAAMFDMSMAANLIMNSDLTKRLGEIRYNPDKAGTWARIYTGRNDISGVGEQKYTSIQGGIDRQIKAERGNHFIGVGLERLLGSNSYDNSGSGKTRATVLSLYDAWSGNDGKYHDLVVKAGRIGNDFDTVNVNGERLNGDYRNWMSGVSFEYGWRKNTDNGYYYQPETQLSYAHVNGASYTTNNGITVDQASGNSLIGRVGLTFGRRFNENEELFFTTNLLREFLGKVRVNNAYGIDTVQQGDSLRGNWCELVLGYNNRMEKQTDYYMQVSKTFGGQVQRKWQLEAGFRWNW